MSGLWPKRPRWGRRPNNRTRPWKRPREDVVERFFNPLARAKEGDGHAEEKVMKELVELIAKSLVDRPEAVDVIEVGGEQTTVLELKVAPEDLGKVIGKQGRTVRSIRTILSAAGMKQRKRFVLQILD